MSEQRNDPAPGAGVDATWNYTLGSIVFLFVAMDLFIVTDFLGRFATTESWADLTLLMTSIAASGVRIRYCWFLRDRADSTLPPTRWTIALFIPALVAWGVAFASPETSLFATVQLWFSGLLFASLLLRRARWALVVFFFVLAATPLLVLHLQGESLQSQVTGMPRWFVLCYGAMLPAMLFVSLWMWRIVQRLDESRHLGAELAVAQERLRFAADLHDIQGHHLQVIALKAELAERTMGNAPEQAAAQVGEIRLIAKEAMEETRSLVAGTRQVGLQDELENAGEVLSLAGVECALDISSKPATPEAKQVLAFAVREATTNILRHSSASWVAISLADERGGSELTVSNNGVDDAFGETHGVGSGLSGLRKRVQKIGGTLQVGSGAEPKRFDLRVWVPGGGVQ